ncbi:hypothetical protein D3C80_1816110 [compost metagenome]
MQLLAFDGIEQACRRGRIFQQQTAQAVSLETGGLQRYRYRLIGHLRRAAGKAAHHVGGVMPALRLLELMHPSPGTIVLKCR